MKSRTLFDSFKYAAHGIKTAFTQERNFRVHCVTAVIVVITGILFGISLVKWALVFTAFGFVFVSELVNTAAETLVDMVTKEYWLPFLYPLLQPCLSVYLFFSSPCWNFWDCRLFAALFVLIQKRRYLC